MTIVDDDPADRSEAESQPAPQHPFAMCRQLRHGGGKEPFQYRQTSKMRRPHSNHFDRTSETTKGVSNTCFSRAVNSEKGNLKPRFARACGGEALPRHHTRHDSFRFHTVEYRQFEMIRQSR